MEAMSASDSTARAALSSSAFCGDLALANVWRGSVGQGKGTYGGLVLLYRTHLAVHNVRDERVSILALYEDGLKE